MTMNNSGYGIVEFQVLEDPKDLVGEHHPIVLKISGSLKFNQIIEALDSSLHIVPPFPILHWFDLSCLFWTAMPKLGLAILSLFGTHDSGISVQTHFCEPNFPTFEPPDPNGSQDPEP